MTAQGETMAPVYDKKLASKPLIIIGYLLALGAPAWIILRKITAPLNYSMTDITVMAICLVVSILVALFIISTRSLSRHHGCFIVIFALLCSFSIVYVVNTDRDVYRETMAIFGKEIPADKEPEFNSNVSPEMRELEKQIQLERNKP